MISLLLWNTPPLMVSQKVVPPVETGVQTIYNFLKRLDSGFRRNDEKSKFQTFYEIISFDFQKNFYAPIKTLTNEFRLIILIRNISLFRIIMIFVSIKKLIRKEIF
jgi:hypothetical protein